MASIKHEVWIDASPERVFNLLNSGEAISTWWDEQTERLTPEGLVLEHSPGPEHGTVKFLVLKAIPNELIKWRCNSHHPDGVPGSEWTDTEMEFRFVPREDSDTATEKWASGIQAQTVLRFEHTGWPHNARYLSFCSYAWAQVLTQLKRKAEEDSKSE